MPVEHEPTISISIEPKDYDQFENSDKIIGNSDDFRKKI